MWEHINSATEGKKKTSVPLKLQLQGIDLDAEIQIPAVNKSFLNCWAIFQPPAFLFETYAFTGLEFTK